MEDTVKKIRSLRETLENTFHAKLTLHDHIGIFTLPDGTKILPGINIHSSPCCAFWYSSRERCSEHCNYGATRRADAERKPFVSTCFCGVTELVMPLFSGNIHAATIFAGMFRQKNFDLSSFPLRYRKLYLQMPEWSDSVRESLEALLFSAGYSMLMLAENLRKTDKSEQGRAGEIRKFFRTRYAQNTGVADLAEVLGLSESRTIHLLQSEFQKGFSQLLTEERLKHVEQLLRESDLPLRKIAEMCGFRNEYYLSTVFKKYCGISPGQKRKIIKDEL
ncbi:MAG: helix-turn-helix domain-containing protein [Lentisphaeria bacterium]|nr:helix-turn-helix domain-containing protein [Lentisphaeria bacterium]